MEVIVDPLVASEEEVTVLPAVPRSQTLKRKWIRWRAPRILKKGGMRDIEEFVDTAKRWAADKDIDSKDVAACLVDCYKPFMDHRLLPPGKRRKMPDRVSVSNLVIKFEARLSRQAIDGILNYILRYQPSEVALELLEDLAGRGVKLGAKHHSLLIRHLTFFWNLDQRPHYRMLARRKDRHAMARELTTMEVPVAETLAAWVRTRSNKPLLGWLYIVHPELARRKLEEKRQA